MLKALMHWRTKVLKAHERDLAEYAAAIAEEKQRDSGPSTLSALPKRRVGSFQTWLARKREREKISRRGVQIVAILPHAAKKLKEEQKANRPPSKWPGRIGWLVIMIGAALYAGWKGVGCVMAAWALSDFLDRFKRNEETLEKIRKTLDRPAPPIFREN